MTGPLEDVAQVVSTHRGELMLPGVLSVRAGWKFRGGWPVDPPTPAIVVTVEQKTPAPPGGALLPESVDGVPVDVRAASARKRLELREPDALRLGGALDPATGAVPEFPDELVTPAVQPRRAAATAMVQAALSAAAAKPQLPYTGPDGVTLAPVTGTVTVQACASPDAGWPVLKAFLDDVDSSITIGLYDWTSEHVLDSFTRVMHGKTVRLVLDHPARNPTADQSDEDTVTTLTRRLGAGLTQAWALERMDPLAAAWEFPTAYHIKVAVADHARVWLSSGNWNNSNQPDIDPVKHAADADAARTGDRDWHVVIHSPELAATFEAYLENDLTVAQAHQREPAQAGPELARLGAAEALLAPALLPAKLQTPPFAHFWPAAKVTAEMTVTPVLTPDAGSYATHVQALIESATTTLSMQFQYVSLPQDPATAPAAYTALLAAVIARQRAGVQVRIIMSQYETQGYLEQLITMGLDVATAVRIQNNVHNKGIVVDGATVLVSSQNWSGAGTTTNRDAGVILQNADVAQYFEAIFQHDWDTLAVAQAAED
jgi:phosphatidylserine/phosphatidylglycerophosphate/cardiolipin synthase-like enzyme